MKQKPSKLLTIKTSKILFNKAKFLKIWQKLTTCQLEKQESLEQLRILWHGYKIKVDTAICLPQQDINTPEDLEVIQKFF